MIIIFLSYIISEEKNHSVKLTLQEITRYKISISPWFWLKLIFCRSFRVWSGWSMSQFPHTDSLKRKRGSWKSVGKKYPIFQWDSQSWCGDILYNSYSHSIFSLAYFGNPQLYSLSKILTFAVFQKKRWKSRESGNLLSIWSFFRLLTNLITKKLAVSECAN